MRRTALAALVAGSLAVASVAAGVTHSAFSSQATNGGNSFQAAASFSVPMQFASGTYSGNAQDNRAIAAGFQPDAVIVKCNTTQVAVARTSTMTGDQSKELAGGTALAADRIQSFGPNGFTIGTSSRVNANGVACYWQAFKGGAGELVLGSYTGNGAASRSIAGVGFSPEYAITLSAGTGRAVQRFAGMTRAFRFEAETGQTNAIASLDADGFTVGSSADANSNGVTYHYLAFNEVAGRIDTGTYTGNGADNRSIPGVGFQPEYVIARANDIANARRGVHRSKHLTGDATLNFTNVANGANLVQALQPDGFQVGSDATVNANGVTYHYVAFKAPPG